MTRASLRDPFAKEVAAAHAIGNMLNMTLQMSRIFENLFVTHMPRAFPRALNYDCGEPECPQLFAKWDSTIEIKTNFCLRAFSRCGARLLMVPSCYLPIDHAQMLATRPEMQLAGGWAVVSRAWNLHSHYAALQKGPPRSPLYTCY